MNQPLRPLPFAMNRATHSLWPTRIVCDITSAHYCGMMPSVQPFLTELTMLGSHHRGWVLLVAPPGRPAAARLQEHGIDPKRVLVVHSHKIKNWQQTLERSLGNGHCAAVFTWLPENIDLDYAKLQRLGQQAGVLTRFFGTPRITPTTPLPIYAEQYAEQDIYLNH